MGSTSIFRFLGNSAIDHESYSAQLLTVPMLVLNGHNEASSAWQFLEASSFV